MFVLYLIFPSFLDLFFVLCFTLPILNNIVLIINWNTACIRLHLGDNQLPILLRHPFCIASSCWKQIFPLTFCLYYIWSLIRTIICSLWSWPQMLWSNLQYLHQHTVTCPVLIDRALIGCSCFAMQGSHQAHLFVDGNFKFSVKSFFFFFEQRFFFGFDDVGSIHTYLFSMIAEPAIWSGFYFCLFDLADNQPSHHSLRLCLHCFYL